MGLPRVLGVLGGAASLPDLDPDLVGDGTTTRLTPLEVAVGFRAVDGHGQPDTRDPQITERWLGWFQTLHGPAGRFVSIHGFTGERSETAQFAGNLLS